jgi:hypothetical protein
VVAISTALPVPKPLTSAITAGHFGYEDGVAIRPGPGEVRAITEQHADRMIGMLEELRNAGTDSEKLRGRYTAALSTYAESFGEPAAARLDSHVRHEATKQTGGLRSR